MAITVTLEGINASGKSSVANELFYLLTNKNVKVEIVKQPDYSAIGANIGKIVRENSKQLSQRTLFYLFLASFSANKELLATKNVDIIIQDRNEISTCVYQYNFVLQQYGSVENFKNWFYSSSLAVPTDLLYYIDVNPNCAYERMNNRGRNDFDFSTKDLQVIKNRYDYVLGFYETIRVEGTVDLVAKQIYEQILVFSK